MQVQLNIRSLRPRDPADDDTVGIQLVAAVQRALRKGSAPAAAVTVRDDRIDIFELPCQAGRQRAPYRGLARAHESNEDDAASATDSQRSPNPRSFRYWT